MRSDPRSARWRRSGAALVGALCLAPLVAVGCGGDSDADASAAPEPTADERAACGRVQDLVDAVVAGESLSAMKGLGQLESALAASSNETLEVNGREFFATISDTVPDAGSLTVEESSELGDRTLEAAQPRLQALLDECAELDLAITNLPTAEGRP